MIFLHEEVLWLGILPVLMALFISTSSKKRVLNIFSPDIYDKLSQNGKSLSYRVRISLFVLALIMMIIALAQPVIEKEKIKLDQRAIDLVVAMDISRSMEAKDLFPSRLQWAKRKLLNFIHKTEVIRVGVMAFAENAYVVTPITEDRDVASYLVDNLDTNNITENGTNLLQLLDASNEQMKDALHKYLLLITDGGDNTNFEEEIAFAKKNRLTLFVLGVGTQKGAPIEDETGNFLKKENKIILTRLNTKIKELALQTGGVYIQSIASDEDTAQMLSEIKKIAEAKTIASKEIRSFVEYFAYFLAAALILLLLAFHSLPQRNILALLLLLSLSQPQSVRASITDFMTIGKATAAYGKGDFNSSKQAFEKLQQESPSDEAAYNLANALYKKKNYKEAIQIYKKTPQSAPFAAKSLHNLGNAYAYSKDLPQAIKAYEEALKITDDKQTKENLEAVKKLQEQEKKKNPDQNKDKKDQEQKKEQKSKDQKDQNSEDKNQDDQEKNDQNNSKDQKEKEKKEQKKQKSDPKEEQEKDKKEGSAKDKSDERSKKEQTAPLKPSQKELTDKDEKRLMQLLQMKKGQTFRYKIPSKFKKETPNDKPW